MSYEIYYKFKVFEDDAKNLFVFSLHGSNNDFFFGKSGRDIHTRNWDMFYRGSEKGLKKYINENITDDFVNIGVNKSISKNELFNKIIKQNRKPLKYFNTFFIEAFKHNYDYMHDVISKVEIKDLYDFEEQKYFYKNSKGEVLRLVDKSLQKILKKTM